MGLFQSLKMIGYQPSHIIELLLHGTKEISALLAGGSMIASDTAQFRWREDCNKHFGDFGVR
jgi:hypothetical protein